MLLLLLVAAVEDQRRADPAEADHVRAARRPGERHLHVQDELLDHGQAAAAVLLRPGGRDPASRVELLQPAAKAFQ